MLKPYKNFLVSVRKKAQAIIDYRNKVGKIKSAAELSNIDGIGEATIEKITPFLSF